MKSRLDTLHLYQVYELVHQNFWSGGKWHKLESRTVDISSDSISRDNCILDELNISMKQWMKDTCRRTSMCLEIRVPQCSFAQNGSYMDTPEIYMRRPIRPQIAWFITLTVNWRKWQNTESFDLNSLFQKCDVLF